MYFQSRYTTHVHVFPLSSDADEPIQINWGSFTRFCVSAHKHVHDRHKRLISLSEILGTQTIIRNRRLSLHTRYLDIGIADWIAV